MRSWLPAKLSALALGMLFAIVAAVPSALALEMKPYDAESFKAAQGEGKPLLVAIGASWCPTCKAQEMILERLKDKPEYADITVYEVDFDSQKDAVKGFKALSQSTLIAFKGDNETGRSAGDASFPGIEDLLMSTKK